MTIRIKFCSNDFRLTCKRPSNVRWIVTHFVGICPFDVIEATSASNSSFLSFNFFTKLKANVLRRNKTKKFVQFYLSIARLANVSLSPFVRWRWQSKVATIPLHASDDDPFVLEDEAPVNGGLCECDDGDVGIRRDDPANDGWIRRSIDLAFCFFVSLFRLLQIKSKRSKTFRHW